MPTEDSAPVVSLEEAVINAMDGEAVSEASQETNTEQSAQEDVQADDAEVSDQGDDDSGVDTEAADDSTAQQEQNRLGYQLRQIRSNDVFVNRQRQNLQNWVNDPSITNDEARLRSIEAENYIEKVERARAQLITDEEQARKELSVFNPQSPDYREAIYDRAIQRYARDQVITEEDANGVQQIVGYKIPLLDYLREEADSYLAGVDSSRKTSTDSKESDSKKAQARMDAASEVTTGGASPEAIKPAKSAFDEAFEAGFNSVR